MCKALEDQILPSKSARLHDYLLLAGFFVFGFFLPGQWESCTEMLRTGIADRRDLIQ